jgi:hypothetical protein
MESNLSRVIVLLVVAMMVPVPETPPTGGAGAESVMIPLFTIDPLPIGSGGVSIVLRDRCPMGWRSLRSETAAELHPTHFIYPASLVVALYPHRTQSNNGPCAGTYKTGKGACKIGTVDTVS